MTINEIKKVFEAESILNSNLYRNGMCPSDLSVDEYASDIANIINDEGYKKELIEENEMG